MFQYLQKKLYFLLFEKIHNSEEAIVIPIGDGFIVGLPATEENLLCLIQTIEELILNGQEEGFELRFAIDIGSVEVTSDINRQNNMVGNLINDTSRIIDSAVANSIVAGVDFIRSFVTQAFVARGEYPISETQMSCRLLDSAVHVDKHGINHEAFAIQFVRGDVTIGKSHTLLRKYQASIFGQDVKKSDQFKDRFYLFESAEKILLYGISHRHSYNVIQSCSKSATVEVYFASDEIIESLPRSEEMLCEKRDSVSSLLELEAPHLDLYEYHHEPRFGASMIDGDIPGKGFVHFSHYYPDTSPEDSPFVEVFWATNEQPPLFTFFRNQLLTATNKEIVTSIN